MKFSVNSPILFVMVGIIILAVFTQSVYFLVRAWKKASELGISNKTLKKTVFSAAVFTIAPAVAILVGVVALSKSLGIALPWLRLSIIGSITYETVAANNALTALGLPSGEQITNPDVFITVLWVMTVGIAAGLILVPFMTKKIQGGISKIGMKDKKWGEILNNAMFIGMISAFLGYVFCDVGNVVKGDTSGLIPVCVMVVSAIIMVICGLLSKKYKIGWLTDYALPLSLVGAMASAIPFTNWLG